MTDQEFRPHVERWLAVYYVRNRLSRLIQHNSAEMAGIKLPKVACNRTSGQVIRAALGLLNGHLRRFVMNL